jgi:GNAT superfamily N-acetyltransferase
VRWRSTALEIVDLPTTSASVGVPCHQRWPRRAGGVPYPVALYGVAGNACVMEIIRADAKNAASAADVLLRSRKESIPAIPPSVHSDDGIRAYITDVAVPLREAWVAVEHAVVGLLVLDDDFINQLYVDPDHQGRGVGAALLDRAKRQRPSGLQLWTFQSNANARRFYERHGFVAVEETDDDNEERAPDVRYVWGPSGTE